MKRIQYLMLSVLTSVGACFLVAAGAPPEPVTIVDVGADAAGVLHVPTNYRDTYQYLGTWVAAAAQLPGARIMDNVYASPGAASAYRTDGHFPDGTTLIKEVFQAATASMTTGTISHADTLKGWFVMVKDSQNTHPDNKLWGDGWGWAWFNAGAPNKTISIDYHTNCLGCHVPAKATDWTYVNGYPILNH